MDYNAKEVNSVPIEKDTADKGGQSNAPPTGGQEEKALVFLEAGMTIFAKKGRKDVASFKLILMALTDAPLYFPVEIDLNAMFGDADPHGLKVGDIIHTNKEVKGRILTAELKDGTEVVPMFTSVEEAAKGPHVHLVRYQPHEYLPILNQMDKRAIIDMFSENRFVLDVDLVRSVLIPYIQKKNGANMDQGSGAPTVPTSVSSPRRTYDLRKGPRKSHILKGFISQLFGRGEKAEEQTCVNKTVERLYANMDKTMRDKVFYGNIAAASNILTKLSQSVFDSLEEEKIELCLLPYLSLPI